MWWWIRAATWHLLIGLPDLSHLNYLNSIISLQMIFLPKFIIFLFINRDLFHIIRVLLTSVLRAMIKETKSSSFVLEITTF